ncbi:MAG TPA: ABC transporter permease [Parvibaculum sp.]
MLVETILLALREIRRNMLRSALTTLGIVIGVAAVIAMVTLGGGAREKVTKDIASLGRNLLLLVPGAEQHGPGGGGGPPFKIADAAAIARNVPNIDAVAPSSTRAELAVYGNENWQTTVTGADPAFFMARDWGVDSGRIFDEAEERAGRMVCVIGVTVARELFGAQDPIGSTIRLGRAACPVIGILSAKGQSSFGTDQDNVVIVPLEGFQRRIAGNDDVAIIYISAHSAETTTGVQKNIEALMKQRRHIGDGQTNDFRVQDMREIARLVEGTTLILTALLGAIAAISLLVGGIGIMNIMLVSVTERTREIGIRLAIGALEREVLTQFLVEAASLSLFGGFIGILLGLGISAIVAPRLGVPFVFDPVIVLIAFLFSGAVGLGFGFFPARRAARLDPIEALRYE